MVVNRRAAEEGNLAAPSCEAVVDIGRIDLAPQCRKVLVARLRVLGSNGISEVT